MWLCELYAQVVGLVRLSQSLAVLPYLHLPVYPSIPPSLYRSIALSLYLSLSLSLCMSVCLCLSMSLCASMSVSLCLSSLFIDLSPYAPLHLRRRLHLLHLSIYLSVFLYISSTSLPLYLSISLSLYLSIALSLYVSVCLPLSMCIPSSLYLSPFIVLETYFANCLVATSQDNRWFS